LGPNRQDIENNEIRIKRESRIPCIEGDEKPFGQRENPLHLIPAFAGAITSPGSHAVAATGKTMLLASGDLRFNETCLCHGTPSKNKK